MRTLLFLFTILVVFALSAWSTTLPTVWGIVVLWLTLGTSVTAAFLVFVASNHTPDR